MPNWISLVCAAFCILLTLFVGGMLLNIMASSVCVTNNTTTTYPPPGATNLLPVLLVTVVISFGGLIVLKLFFGQSLFPSGVTEASQSVRHGRCYICKTEEQLYTLHSGGKKMEVCASCLYR